MEDSMNSSLLDVDADDPKYLCGLSTILVAHIQELKDRISQIELIFCGQLFPSFQSRSRILQKKALEAKKAAEEDWKKKENTLYCQIEDLLHEKQCAQEQIQQLNLSLEESKTRLMSSEQLLNRHEFEKKQILDKIESFERREVIIVRLNEQLEQLNLSLEESKTRLMSSNSLLNKHESEKKQLLSKLVNLESNKEIITGLKQQLEQKIDEVAKGKEVQEKLQQQIRLKDQKLLVEQRKRKDLFDEFIRFKGDYKSLKSQYNFLLGKIDDYKRNTPRPDNMEEEKDSNLQKPYWNKRSPQDSRNKDQETSQLPSIPNASKIVNICQNKLEDGQDIGLLKIENISHNNLDDGHNIGFDRTSNADYHIDQSSNSSSLPPKSLAGQKRAASWRHTRARQEPGGADPHDDFLDTPMEMVRNLNMGPQEEVQDLPVLAPKDMDFNNSDDETQEINAGAVSHEQLISIQGPAANKSFKYVEPVRKKAERENLKGVECRQCKKFYDAVLPEGRENVMRCEHHDGVSRHRYRFAPPLTPEGFWNIGFESDL